MVKRIRSEYWSYYTKIDHIPNEIYSAALRIFRKDYPDSEFNIVKFNSKTTNISFIWSPNFTTEENPEVYSSTIIYPDGKSRKMTYRNNRPIYHHTEYFF